MTHLKTPGKNPRYHFVSSVCFKMLLCYKICYRTCWKTCNMFCKQIILCQLVQFMIRLKTTDTIYDTLENPMYHLWYIRKLQVLFMVHLKTPCKNPRYHFVLSVCFKMLLCYKICYKTCCKTWNMFCKQIILCQ
jgi:hypothetical protein